ncbi:MAG: Hsp70 family protein, partial [Oscillospiraceae bacterium]
SSNMSDAEIQKAVQDAQQYAAEDDTFRQATEARGQLQKLLAQAEELQKQEKSKDKQRYKVVKEVLDAPTKAAKKALAGKKPEDVIAACAALETALNNL